MRKIKLEERGKESSMAFFSKQKKNGLNANTEGNEKQVIRPSESLGSVLRKA